MMVVVVMIVMVVVMIMIVRRGHRSHGIGCGQTLPDGFARVRLGR